MSSTKQYAKAWSKPLAGILLIVIVGLLMVLDYTGALGNYFSGSTPQVSAVFANTETLQTKDPVRVNGVDVGTVLSVKPIDGGRDALVKMSVNKDSGTLYRNATAAVRWRTVLGGAYYVAIDPGTPGSGQLGSARIPASQTTSEVELDQITSIVQGGARTGLQNLFPSLGQALANPHVLGNLLSELNSVAPSVTTGVGALRGEVQDTDLEGLVKNADATVRSLDAPDNQLRQTVSGAASLLANISNNSTALEDTLATAPTTERIADQTLTQLDTTLDLANPLINRLEAPSRQIAPTLTQLQPTVVKGNTLLNSATPLLASLRTALPVLSTASVKSDSVVTSLQPSLTNLQGQVLPYALAIDPSTGHSAAEMVGSGLGGLAEAAAPEDENGHFIYFPAASGNESTYLPCNEYLGNTQEPLVQCESLNTILGNLFDYSPLSAAPGTATSSGSPLNAVSSIRKSHKG